MKATARHKATLVGLHLLVAVALSLVINFSYLLMPLITQRGGVDSRSRRNDDATSVIEREAVRCTRPATCTGISHTTTPPTAYTSRRGRSAFKLEDGDRLVVSVQPPSGFPKHRISRRPPPAERRHTSQRRGVRLRSHIRPAEQNVGVHLADTLLCRRLFHPAVDNDSAVRRASAEVLDLRPPPDAESGPLPECCSSSRRWYAFIPAAS